MRAERHTYNLARHLRREMSPPELRLWARLRAPADGCPRFRRQHPMGWYVLDFYCPLARLAVEVDGGAHALGDRPARDAVRDGWLTGQNVHVLRLTAGEVMRDPDTAADSIVQLAMARVAAKS